MGVQVPSSAPKILLSVVTHLTFTTIYKNNQLSLKQQPIIFLSKKRYQALVFANSGVRIAKTRFANEAPLKGTENEIIEQIHSIRYAENNPYVITGGHFSQLYVRNLGVFFNALLDQRIPSSKTDWLKREGIALKTVALDLEAFSQAKKDFTTITHLAKNYYTGFNIYTRPSDSLFAILYTLCALTDDTFIQSVFPSKKPIIHTLHTKQAGLQLLQTYHNSLTKLIKNYYDELLDPATGLIRTSLLLASARDGIKRQSSFYDNVILWATIRLAKKLQLYSITDNQMQTWRKRIIETFWDSKTGIFLDDLSTESKKTKLFSADSFIILSTGFINLNDKTELRYLKQMVEYVKRNQLDIPFPLHYSLTDQLQKLYWPVRYFAPSYMGTSIWSHWGMEYIKALHYLGGNYLTDVKQHLAAYKHNIEQYGGYPELYDKDGKLLQTRLYRSVLHNGWVINYEQAKMLAKSASA